MTTKQKLSYDGKGINDKSAEFAPRIATFTSPEAATAFGPLFEASSDLLEALSAISADFRADKDCGCDDSVDLGPRPCHWHKHERAIRLAIAKAKGERV